MKHTFLLFFFLSLTGLAAQKYADCDSANYICHKSTYVFHQCSGEGQNTKEADWSSCFLNGDDAGGAEKNSTWMKFHIKEGGKLMFIIAPKDSLDDIDFVVFKLNEDGQCRKKMKEVRCMAAGDINMTQSPCMGKTGLWATEKDKSEDAGCTDAGDNNFLAPLDVKPGEWYALMVSNMTSTTGFFIKFLGDAKLMCED